MKKALVLALVLVLGVGIFAFAGPLTGSWSFSVTLDPDAAAYSDFVDDLSASLALDYTVGGWTFGSSSTFDILGWSAQSFTATGTLGAFTFDSKMNFKPRTITGVTYSYTFTQTYSQIADVYWTSCWLGKDEYVTKTYGAAFDDWTVTGSVSIAGVDFEGLFFLEGYAGDTAAAPFAFYWDDATGTLVQTAGDTAHVLAGASTPTTTGSGYRFKASGAVGDLNITSYTYFNLSEGFTTVTCGQSLTKKGTYTIASSGCGVGFTEEYLHISGLSLGCATFEAGLDINCSGFNWLSFKASSISLLPPLGLTGDFQVTFGTKTKTADLCFNALTFGSDCFSISGTLDYSGTAVTGFTVNSISLSHEWNGITFSGKTMFNGTISTVTDDANQVLVMVPVTGMKNAAGKKIASIDNNGKGYYDAVCYYTEKYDVWEQFTIKSTGDSCCGGAFSFSVTTSFGTKKELDAIAWDYQFAAIGEASGANPSNYPAIHVYKLFTTWLEAGETATVAGVTGGTDVNGDGAVDAIVHAATATSAGEQLKKGALYEDATSDQLFQWVSTDVDLSFGISSAWTITGGIDIDVYGWNSLEFGVKFSF